MTLDINKLKANLNRNTIIRRVDKKEFINDLRAIPTNYVEIQFSSDTHHIKIMQPQSDKYINHIARN
jgi:hypothetical protein